MSLEQAFRIATCPLCEAMCGVLVEVDGQRIRRSAATQTTRSAAATSVRRRRRSPICTAIPEVFERRWSGPARLARHVRSLAEWRPPPAGIGELPVAALGGRALAPRPLRRLAARANDATSERHLETLSGNTAFNGLPVSVRRRAGSAREDAGT